MADPISELFRRSEMLEVALKESKSRGIAAAAARRDYQVKLAEKLLQLREQGLPVSISPDVARGEPKIAQLRFEKDCAEVVYETARDAVNVYKKQIDVLREQIQREWNNA